MDADERSGRLYVAHNQSDGFFDTAIPVRAGMAAKAVNAELPESGGEIRRRNLLDFTFAHTLIISRKRGKSL
jgi:hypothetical protein